MSDRPVFSTDPQKMAPKQGDDSEGQSHLAAGPIKMRLESSGRGGKVVTVLFNLPMTEGQARDLQRELQALLGIGGTFKGNVIELRGDQREKIEAFAVKRSLRIVRAGG